MSLKRALTILLLALVPPTAALALATALGWLRFEWSLGGVGLAQGVYGSWVAALAGVAQIVDVWRGKKPPDSRPGAPNQAPRPLAEFVGRQAEIQRLIQALKPGGKAAITGLVGMGGLGKTELAKVVAARVARRFPDGVLWADCGTQELAAVADLWAAAWGVQLIGDDLPAKAAAWRGLASSKAALLIFDDILPGQDVAPLLPPPGRNAILITSRHANHPALRGAETRLLDQFTPAEAAALAEAVLGRAAARAQVIDAAHLFKLLGYLPLAVSVALHLARDCGWTLAQLNDQLEKAGAIEALARAENLPKSLQATFETSWEHLPDDLQLTFRTLALFNAGPSFSTAALAEALAVDKTEAGALLRRLAGRSLLNRAGGDRWALHPLLREFAAGRPPVDEATQARLARHYEQVAYQANNLFKQGHEHILRGLALFDLEWPHIRAGQAWATARAGADEEAARLCSDYPDAAAYCLSLRLHPREQIAWREAAAAAARQLGDKEAEGNHLGNLGNAYVVQGKAQQAIEYYRQALGITLKNDKHTKGKLLGNLGIAYYQVGKIRQAIDCYEEGLGIHREIGNKQGEVACLGNLGRAYAALGNTQRAIDCYEQALAITRKVGDRRGEGIWLGSLGQAYATLEDTQQAIEFYKQALVIHREIGDRQSEGADLGSLGRAYAALGEAQRAIDYHKQALTISREISDRRGEGQDLDNLGLAYADLDETRRAIEYHEQALAIAREIDDRRGESNRLGNLGLAYATLGETQRALVFYELALAIAREIGDKRGEGNALGNLGLAYAALGDLARAGALWAEALRIYAAIEDPRAAQVRALLAAL